MSDVGWPSRLPSSLRKEGGTPAPLWLNFSPASALGRTLFLVLVIVSLSGCVSTPEGSKFNPIEGAKRIDQNIDATIDHLQDRKHVDTF